MARFQGAKQAFKVSNQVDLRRIALRRNNLTWIDHATFQGLNVLLLRDRQLSINEKQANCLACLKPPHSKTDDARYSLRSSLKNADSSGFDDGKGTSE